MKNYNIVGSYIEIILDNDKKVKVGKKYIDNCIEKLDIDLEEALLTWLEDEGYMDNLDQLELCDQAKENKSNKIVGAKKDTPVKKTQKERTQKPQPEKECIIRAVAEFLESATDASNINIENKAKIITFTYKDNDYKLDLTQKRKPKV